MPDPWVPLRQGQLFPVNKVVDENEKLEKGLEKEYERKDSCTTTQCSNNHSSDTY
jgi:hypothetical protein